MTGSGGSRFAAVLAAWLGAFLLFLCFAAGNLDNSDAAITMHAARALWLRGDSGLRGPEQAPEWRSEAQIAAYVAAEAADGRHAYGKLGSNGLTYVWFPVGHIALMVPTVALGEALQRRLPAAEATFRERTKASPQSYVFGEFVLLHAATAMILPPLSGATALLLLYGIGRALAAARRDAALAALAIAVASQLFPLGRESLSDGPALCFLLGALLVVVRANAGVCRRWELWSGGLLCGAAVLSRYQHALVIPALFLALLAAARRQRQAAIPLWFAAGGLPCLLLLLWLNHARFGSLADTGYPPFWSWFNYPPWLGLIKLLVAAGKGLLWFSPLLWLALPVLWRRGEVTSLRWLALVLLAIPLLLFSSTSGWQSGQCWGVRYVTPGVVGLLAIVLPQQRPWQRWPRLFAGVLLLGCLVNLTGVVAPSRGHNQLAGQAVAAYYDRALADGRITAADRDSVDLADHFYFLPRFSPLHANWTYAVHSLRGDYELPGGAPRHGSAHTIEPLFGVAAMPGKENEQGLAPVRWEDRHGRHLWWVFWGELTDISCWLLLLPVLTLGLVCSWFGWRRLLAD